MNTILSNIKKPADIKNLSIDELEQLSTEIRSFLIDSISKTGGHIGTALGVVELTIAIHKIFFMPKDKVIFDTGHQGYTHKLLTGRKDLFETLNQPDGMSRFLTRDESEYDLIDASHAGTAISLACGIALNIKLNDESAYAVAVVGDGALVEGMSAEGLNYGVAKKLPLIIVLNDNGMAIPVNVGGIKNLCSGDNWVHKSRKYFEALGYQHIYVNDGHNIRSLIETFEKAKIINKQGSVLVHVKTEKGRGLNIAKNHKYKMHFSMPFNPETGAGSSPVPSGKTYATVAGDKLYEIMGKCDNVIAITPSTPYASGLDACLEDFPVRMIDVGMAEQHALGMATGLALSGKMPFVFYQSTFMQRAFDQIIHDVCFMSLPITIFAVRSGFAGLDSPTHHGIYDISYLRALPNIKIFYPGHSSDLEEIMEYRSKNSDGPMIVLYPYESVLINENDFKDKSDDIEKDNMVLRGKDGYILSVGNTMCTALELRRLLKEKNLSFGLVNIRWLQPLRRKGIFDILENTRKVITTEEGVLSGGFGSSIAELITDKNLECDLLRSAIDQGFVKPGEKLELEEETGIDTKSILRKMVYRWPELFE